MNEVIRLKDVIKITGGHRRTVSGVSLCVAKGEHVQICGAPGGGKTMLMRLIAGMEHPNDGEIFVRGKAVHQMTQNEAACFRRETFGVMLRRPGFLPGLATWENVALPLAIQRVPAARRKETSMELLRALGLKYIAYAGPQQLSAYEKQLVSLARAWVIKPEILLLEELTAGLSNREAGQIMGILQELSRQREATVILFAAAESAPVFAGRQLNLDHGTIKGESQ